MKTLLKVVGGLLLILILFICGIGILGSGSYEVAKAITIDRPPEKVHPYIADLKKWPGWAPWQKHDETIKVTLGSKSEGAGASQTWTSKDGDGELTITKSDPSTGIEYDMAFIMDDQRYPARSAMTYLKTEGGTEVSWTMSGEYGGGFTDKIFAFIMPWIIKPMFGEGLEDLKTVVESEKQS